ncbi:hypothetical protein [Clostridium senegalense]|uniref:hypothetical protein n=1 Tax=Clostridium senegalense TaxID=1465809 RepID=UPI000287FB2B|nr:hypothetical protein [Clostridium senegalense]
MKNLDKLTPRVSKKILLLIAGIVWGFAGFRVLTIGLNDVKINNGYGILSLIIATVIFFMFFKFIFSKMLKKHTKRIINSSLEKHCAFSFFDFKSYIIMGFMISLGVGVRSIGVFNPVYVGDFYIGLGFALFISGLLFLINSLNFQRTIEKYKI